MPVALAAGVFCHPSHTFCKDTIISTVGNIWDPLKVTAPGKDKAQATGETGVVQISPLFRLHVCGFGRFKISTKATHQW